MEKTTLSTLSDVQRMVRSFYSRVQKDALLGPIFEEKLAGKWEDHLPKMDSFWESMLFGTGTYKGRPFDAHLNLPVTSAHFQRWVSLFTKTIEENFTGDKAKEAIARAKQIAMVFENKIDSFRHGPHFIQ